MKKKKKKMEKRDEGRKVFVTSRYSLFVIRYSRFFFLGFFFFLNCSLMQFSKVFCSYISSSIFYPVLYDPEAGEAHRIQLYSHSEKLIASE